MQQTLTAIFDTGAATHVGKVRERNEDSYLVRPEAASGRWPTAWAATRPATSQARPSSRR